MRCFYLCSAICLTLVAMVTLTGCGVQDKAELVAYVAHDSEFSQPVLDDFEQASGITVQTKFDTESTKTVGLTNALISEASRPRCDVFWNNEILNTLRLQNEGLLQAYASPEAENYPAMFRSPDDLWCGFAARARILIVNTDLMAADERPSSILDLARPEYKGRCGIAKPLFGTTASHAACLFAAWGDEQAKAYFQSLKDNDVQVMSGNKQVAMAVAEGELLFGLTDTDDAMVAIRRGKPVTIIYPDQADEQVGTLFIPNTVAIMKDCPHPEAARKLVDYVLSAKAEAALAASESAQIPLNSQNADVEAQVETPLTVKAMEVDFNAAADQWDKVAAFMRETFGT